MCLLFFVLFFFFKQKTAYEMRISDWSSDVCSSDLRWGVACVAYEAEGAFLAFFAAFLIFFWAAWKSMATCCMAPVSIMFHGGRKHCRGFIVAMHSSILDHHINICAACRVPRACPHLAGRWMTFAPVLKTAST